MRLAGAVAQPAASELLALSSFADGLSGIWCVWHGGAVAQPAAWNCLALTAIADGLSGIWCVWHGNVGCAAGGIGTVWLSEPSPTDSAHLVRLAWRRRPRPAASELFGGEAEQQPTLQIEGHAELQLLQQQLEEPVAEAEAPAEASVGGGSC